jgi:hypothetical protein
LSLGSDTGTEATHAQTLLIQSALLPAFVQDKRVLQVRCTKARQSLGLRRPRS